MAFNGSGVFNRLYTWVTDRANGIVVSADRFDAEDDGFAAGLSNCICKDGQTTITNNIPFANYKITGLGSGTVRTDAANLGQVQDNLAQWAGTAGGTANAITVNTTPAITAYAAGQRVWFIALSTNTGATTIAWSALAAKNAFWAGAAMAGGEIVAGRLYEAVYDGTQFQVIGVTTSLSSGDAGAGEGPSFELYRNSASPAAADLLGVISYTGQNSTPAKITYAKFGAKLDDPTAASEDASFVGTIKSAGSDVSVLLNAFGLSIGSATIGRVCEGRLTLTSGTAVTTSDVTAATTIYWTPYKGNQIAVYNGSRWEVRAFAEMSIAVPAGTATNYDVFFDYNSGTPQLVVTAWTNDTTRATAIALQDGIYVKSGTATQRYLGTFRQTGVSGQTEDSATNRLVWNMYNRVPRAVSRADATASWTYSSANWRQANGSTSNQITFVRGLDEDAADVYVTSIYTNSTTANVACFTGIGLDSTTAPATTSTVVPISNYSTTNANVGVARYSGFPGLGKHYLSWLEYGNAAAVQTWQGSAAIARAGLVGTLLA